MKRIIGILTVCLCIFGAFGISFADINLEGKMKQWFEEKTKKAYQELEEAIMSEKESQKKRIYEEMKREVNESSEQINAFTLSEKQKRIDEIQSYANSIIQTIHIDTEQEKENITKQLNEITERAKMEINQVYMQTKLHSTVPKTEIQIPKEEPKEESKDEPVPTEPDAQQESPVNEEGEGE